MKKLINSLIVLLITLAAPFAHAAGNFYDILTKKCDGNAVQAEPVERFFVDGSLTMVGWGKLENNCMVMNFYSAVMTKNDGGEYELVVNKPIGKRSGCSDEVTQADPIKFKKAFIRSNEITLFDTSECKILEMTTKLRDTEIKK